MEKILIHTEYIELKNVLKIKGFISTGGEAKPYLMERDVLVNGVKENRRGRKLYIGDIVNIESIDFVIANEN